MNQQLLHDEWEENILARAAGELNDEESARFDEHLASCAACTQEVRDYEFLARRFRSVEQDVVVPALSPVLLAMQQEMVQHRIQEEAQQIAEQTFARESEKRAQEERSERELVELVQAGDRDAFAALYDRYAAGVHRYLLKLTHDREDADDLVQATFTTCLQYLERERRPFHFKPWLYAVARHVSLDYVRQKKKERVAVALLDAEYQADLEAGEGYERTSVPPVLPKDQPYLPGPGVDEQTVVREMLHNTDSEHWKACSNFVRHRVHAEAENIPIDAYDDVAQEVMYKVKRGLPGFRFTSSLKGWVNTIIEHTIIDMHRKVKSEASMQVPLIDPSGERVHEEVEEPKRGEAKSAEDIFMLSDEVRAGWEACLEYARAHANPNRNQLIIWKVIYEGETYAEAALAAGCSEAIVGYVVRQAQSYARKLREYS